MEFSLNETEGLCKRAARGAGLSWGLAEEAGKAARWLAAVGLPGPALLAAELEQVDGQRYDALAPSAIEGMWAAPGGVMSPLIAGAALSDLADDIAAGRAFLLGPTSYPLLLTPFVANAAKACGMTVMLGWQEVKMLIAPGGFSINGSKSYVQTQFTRWVRCLRTSRRVAEETPRLPCLTVDEAVWRHLESFAQRTFAPATEQSRRAGAGGAVGDDG